MTKSYPSWMEADYTPSDMGQVEKPSRKEDWKKHVPEWEGWSEKEKQRWIDEKEKEEEIKLDTL